MEERVKILWEEDRLSHKKGERGDIDCVGIEKGSLAGRSGGDKTGAVFIF